MLIIFDGDGTLWEGELIAGYLTLPLKLIDNDTVEDFVGKRISLKRDVRETLEELKKKGIYVALASENRHMPVESFLRKLRIHGYFNFLKISFDSKDEMVWQLLDEFRKQKKDPGQIIFVDDYSYNIMLVMERETLKDVRCIDTKELGSIKNILTLI
jgi:magnesium-dependent phosphatase-1